MATEQELLTAKEKYTNDLLARRGVHAVGIGLKERGGVLTNELAIVCFVDTKLELSKLDPDDIVPQFLDGVPTDVQVTPAFEPFTTDPNDLQQNVRPVAGGLQLQVDQHYGTLGFTGMFGVSMVAVSNQHVLAPNGVTVYQPTDAKHQDIGTTTATVLSSDVDGGYTTLTTATGSAGVYSWNGSGYTLLAVKGTFTPTLGDLPYPVWKTGRTTGTTTGNITALYVSGTRTDGWNYVNQILITPDSSPFSSPGDSGSGILDSQSRVVALLWGGGTSFTLGSPIAAVMAQLGITVPTSVGERVQQPVAVSGFDELLAKLNSGRGRKIVSFVSEFGPVIRELIYTDYRVGVVWAHHHGHQICNAIIENVATQSTPLPGTIAGAPTKHAFEQFGEVLLKRGSPALRSAIEAIREDIEWLIDRPLADVTSER
jgi:hypothetical protein